MYSNKESLIFPIYDSRNNPTLVYEDLFLDPAQFNILTIELDWTIWNRVIKFPVGIIFKG